MWGGVDWDMTDHRLVYARVVINSENHLWTGMRPSINNQFRNRDYSQLKSAEIYDVFNARFRQEVEERELTSRCNNALDKLMWEADEDDKCVNLLYEDCLASIKIAIHANIPKVMQISRSNVNWFSKARTTLIPLIRNKQKTYIRWRTVVNRQKVSPTLRLGHVIKLRFEEYITAGKHVKRECLQCREHYYSNVVKDLEALFNANDMLKYYAAIGTIITPSLSSMPVRGGEHGVFVNSEGGLPVQLVQGLEEVVGVWARYFHKLLNQQSRLADNVEQSLRDHEPVKEEYDKDFNSSEFELAIRQCRVHRAAGMSTIPIEPVAWGTDEESRRILLQLYDVIWNVRKVPQAFRDSIIIPLHKSGDKRICNNYRALSLNEHEGKLLERLILNRLLQLVKEVPEAIPESQCGFVPGRSTMQASFVDRTLTSECRSRGLPLFKCYVDLTKAYDRVDRQLLWKILERLGVPTKMLAAIKGLHEGARGRVKVDGVMSDWFELSVGLRQGAIFSPTLFNIFFGEIIRQMRIQFKSKGLVGAKIVIFRRKGIMSKGVKLREGDVDTEVAHIFEALFADDLVLFASSAVELQEMIDILDKIVTDFGQEISIKKTKIMIVQMKTNISRHEGPMTLQFFCKGQELEIVDRFKYLGGLDTDDAKMTEEIKVRSQRMRGAYAKYAKGIFQSTLKVKMKINLFNAIVVMNGLFGCQVLNVTQTHINELEAVHFTLLRRMLGKTKREWGRGKLVEWADSQYLKVYPLEWVMMKLQLRYAGREIRVITDKIHTLPHNMLFRGHVANAPRLEGGLEQAYPATLMRAVELCGLTRTKLLSLAKDRKVWNRYLEETAMVTFMKGWYERENTKKEVRNAHQGTIVNRGHHYFGVDEDIIATQHSLKEAKYGKYKVYA